MLVFGHAGITLGAAALLVRALVGTPFFIARGNGLAGPNSYATEVVPVADDPPAPRPSWLVHLGNPLNIGLLLIGSLLPDIIDKPVGQIIFRELFSNGRIFCHTLAFPVLLVLAGLYLYKRRGSTWLIVLSFGAVTHIVLDQMWRSPQTLLWPRYGLAFERRDVSNTIPRLLHSLFSDPQVYVPEAVGVVIVAWFFWTLLRYWRSNIFN